MKLKQFLNFPAIYKERNNDVKIINPMLLNVKIYNEQPLIIYKYKNYIINILLIGQQIDEDNEIKMSCTCPSFIFEFANSLYKSGNLFEPEKFIKSIKQVPKDKNKFNILTGCKHCISCCRHLFKYMDTIQLSINNKIKRKSNG